MKITSEKNGVELVISLDGRLDTNTAPDLESYIAENYDGKGNIVFDCGKLAYVSSAGLRVLLATHKKTKGNMKLTEVCELIMEVLEITGFSDIFDITESK